ncbi:MAG TPA: hypothetical protein P5232_02300 [Candidatus Moranbacteria bacterium]|nr:hypothetical protein [Candidatus Moranbacteria bacterium]
MFGQKTNGSNDPQNKNLSTDGKMNFNEDNFKVEEFPIHTMKNDLKELQNPTEKKSIPTDDISIEKNSFFGKKPETVSPEKNGPFFQAETPKPQEKSDFSDIRTAPAKIEPAYSQEPKELPREETKEVPKETPAIFQTPKENIPPVQSHGIGKAIFVAVIIFIILIVCTGGYYFWMTRVSISPEEIALPETVEPIVETIPDETIALPALSAQNSNYLQINLTDATAESLKTTLNSYTEKVLATKTIGAFEFLITDEKNNPITFKDFADKSGLILAPAILSNLNSDFSLYIYNYGENTRFGLSISSKNDTLLKTALLKEEKNLFKGLSPLYPALTANPLSTFSTTAYKNNAVRYLNITTPDDYAVDYIIINKKLLIGTTKTATFSILDRILAPKNEDSLENSNENTTPVIP